MEVIMKKLIYVAIAVIGVSEVCEGMLETLSFNSPTKLPSPYKWPENKSVGLTRRSVLSEKPTSFKIWTKTIDIDYMLGDIIYNGYSVDDINENVVSETLKNVNDPLNAIGILFYAQYSLDEFKESALVQTIMSSLQTELEKHVTALFSGVFCSSLNSLENIKEEKDKYLAQLAIALFESQFSNENELKSYGYNGKIVKHSLLTMNRLDKKYQKQFLQEAGKRILKFGLHVSTFLLDR
jgi:hypothetical protein